MNLSPDGVPFRLRIKAAIVKPEEHFSNPCANRPTVFISRNFNRFVSLFLTRFFLVLRLTPNSISFGNLGLGVLAAVLIATTSPGEYWKILVSGLIFQLTSIVDGCDGEVAKLSFSDSDKGAWIDTVCDQLGYFTFFIGLPVGLFHATKNPLYIVLGGMTFVFIGLLFYMMDTLCQTQGRRRQHAPDHQRY